MNLLECRDWGLKKVFLRMMTKKVVGKLTGNFGPHRLPFGGGSSFRLAPALSLTDRRSFHDPDVHVGCRDVC